MKNCVDPQFTDGHSSLSIPQSFCHAKIQPPLGKGADAGARGAGEEEGGEQSLRLFEPPPFTQGRLWCGGTLSIINYQLSIIHTPHQSKIKDFCQLLLKEKPLGAARNCLFTISSGGKKVGRFFRKSVV